MRVSIFLLTQSAYSGVPQLACTREQEARDEIQTGNSGHGNLISASTSGGDEASSQAAGANAFLPKPINLGLLLAQIGNLLKLTWMEAPATAGLVAPPPEEMETLHYLARRGNMQDILQQPNHLTGLDERYRHFADRLSLLAKEYRSKAILSLVKQYLEEHT